MHLIEQAVAELEQGNIILYPTDTVYGLGVDALNLGAITKLRELKSRGDDKAFLIIVPDMESMSTYAIVNESAKSLAEKFLPGPLTLILPSKDTLPSELTYNGTIGIRIPNDTFCLELAKSFGRPFISTSANISGLETRSTVDEILEQFGDRAQDIALTIDAGEKGISKLVMKPSTIVLCTTDMPEIIREGALTREMLGL